MVLKSIIIRAGILGLVMVLLTFGTFSAIASQPAYGGTFVFPIGAEPPHLNAGISIDALVVVVGSQIFDTLVRVDKELNILPNLAQSWEISSDGQTYTFHLVRNATWHDGQPVTSEDVKYTFETAQVLYGRGKSMMDNVNSVEIPDNYTVTFRLKQAFGPFLVSCWFARIIPSHLYNGTDIMANPYNAKPVGSGPFVFKEWVKGSHITLVKNEKYWKSGLPYLDEIRYVIMPDPVVRNLALETGEIDMISYFWVDPPNIARLLNVTGIKADYDAQATAARFTCLAFNMNKANGTYIVPVLANEKVRQAIAWAINKTEILEKANYGNGDSRATTWVAPATAWAWSPDCEDYQPRDVAKANTLLDEAGYPRGTGGIRFSLRAIWPIDQVQLTTIADIVKDQLRDVGIEIVLQGVEKQIVAQRVWTTFDYDIDVAMFTGGLAGEPYLGQHFYHGNGIKAGVTWTNCVGYNNSEVNELLDLALREPNRTKSGDYYKEAQAIAAKELPYFVLYNDLGPTLYHDDFVNVVISGYSLWDSFDTTYWTEGAVVASGIPNEVLVAAVVAAVVIAGLASLMYLRRRRRKTSTK